MSDLWTYKHSDANHSLDRVLAWSSMFLAQPSTQSPLISGVFVHHAHNCGICSVLADKGRPVRRCHHLPLEIHLTPSAISQRNEAGQAQPPERKPLLSKRHQRSSRQQLFLEARCCLSISAVVDVGHAGVRLCKNFLHAVRVCVYVCDDTVILQSHSDLWPIAHKPRL